MQYMYNVIDFLQSWQCDEGNVTTNEEIMQWIASLNLNTKVEIIESKIRDDTFWYYDKDRGVICNRKNSFFQIGGIIEQNESCVKKAQPIIFQNEIGFLGIICKKINGVVNFLMQAKIEPGNLNCIQISPTIQATKSNFTRAHGGKSPRYLEYFMDSAKHTLIYDQLQSEQASRFYKKRNRNMVLALGENEDIEEYNNFKWMTLGQIKGLMEIDNLVNMDTRTVLAGIPFEIGTTELPQEWADSVFCYRYGEYEKKIKKAYNKLNDYKMYSDFVTSFCALEELEDWELNPEGVFCRNDADFEVKFYDISIEGREVQEWMQPLVKAKGIACFGLIQSNINGTWKYLVKLYHEIGSFDKAEFGPSVQLEFTHNSQENDVIENYFFDYALKKGKVLVDVLLSEEGGRFYHEQNRNVIISVDYKTIPPLPDNYAWLEFGTLNQLGQNSHCLNIQLRNLLSLIKMV